MVRRSGGNSKSDISIRQREVAHGFFSQYQGNLFTIHLNIGQEHRNLAIICLLCSKNLRPFFSAGFSAQFKNNASIFHLIHQNTDFGLNACWTFTATGHGNGAGDGVGAVLKLDVLHSRRTFFYLRRRISMSFRDKIKLKQPTHLTKPILLLPMSPFLKQTKSNLPKLLFSRQEGNR